MSLLPLFYFEIIVVGIIRLSNGYNEFQRCIDLREFDTYRFLKGVKTSVNPCTDFYQYGCGNWQRNYPKPADYIIWSTFGKIQYETYHRVHELLMKEDEDDALPFIKIAKQYHRSCMNEGAIEGEGLKPIKLMLETTGEWPILMSDLKWYSKEYTWQNTYNTYNDRYGFSNIFSLTYKQDERDKTRNIFQISLSFENEEQLLKDTCRHANIDTILDIIHAFAIDQGINNPLKQLRPEVDDIITFERKVRKFTSKGNMTRMTVAELQHFYSSFTKASVKINWFNIIQSSFKHVNLIINASEHRVLVNKNFFQYIADVLDVTQPHIIVNYMQWNMVCRLMKYLNKQMRNIESECHSNCNVTQEGPRWFKCVQDIWIPHLTSYLYVKTYISADVLKAVSKMVDEIKAEIKERISLSPWLSDYKKNYMIDKLEKVLSYIGYPKWYANETAFIEHYKGLELGENYFENILAIAKHERKKFYAAIRDSNIDMYSWSIYPIATIAVDVSWENKIVIPLALIQEPFFTLNGPSALNYGAIGFIIEHQFAHSLALGEPKTWKCLMDYFNNITRGVTDDYGNPITYGNTALKEYSADIIGVHTAFAAFKKYKAKMKPSNLWSFKNVTGDQLFFLSFANIMYTSTNARDIIQKFSGHVHEKFRVIGSLMNTKSFSEAFECQLDSPMNPVSKCKLWEHPST